jgi:hypothetical protein
MFSMFMHAANAPHVHGDDPVILIAIVAMLAAAAACLIGARAAR